MQKIKFIDRKRELEFLENLWKEKGFKLVIIFGRRRVGKTELIKKFQENKKHIYYLCDKGGTERNALRFARIASFLFGDVPPSVEYGFENVFSYIKNRIGKEKIVITLDEFAYLIEKDSAIPSIFQRIVDEILKDTEIMLILCGSSMGMMYEHTLSAKSPLYGRKKGFWEVKPLSFRDVCKFFPSLKIEEIIKIFSVFGNIPSYLKEVDVKLSLEENVKEKIMRKGSPLYREPEILLLEEFKEPGPYQNILEAMSREATLSKIASKANLEAKDLPKYLKKLIQLSLVRREYPVTEKKGKTKKSLYFINDNLFFFWYKFCSRNLSFLEEGREEFVFKKYVKDNLPHVFAKGFEEVCRELVTFRFPVFERTGRWWRHVRDETGKRNTEEIDILALNEKAKEILLAECRWQRKVNARKICKELAEKSQYVRWHNDKRRESFAIFAKSFSKRISEFEGRKVYCFDLKDMEKMALSNTGMMIDK